MDRPFSQTLSFDDLEVLVLVENGGATPRELDVSLGTGPRETKAVVRDLVRRGLLDWEGRTHASGVLAPALDLCLHRLPAHPHGPQLETG